MRYTRRKGWQASKKDVWSLNDTLDPIIAAGLRKFLETDFRACPGSLLTKSMVGHTDAEIEEGIQLWRDKLKQMLYAFEAEEPDCNDYDFESYWVDPTGRATDIFDIEANTPYSIEHTNHDVYLKYRNDGEQHELKCKQGRELFAKHYGDLWV
jgi:hypothetical protein